MKNTLRLLVVLALVAIAVLPARAQGVEPTGLTFEETIPFQNALAKLQAVPEIPRAEVAVSRDPSPNAGSDRSTGKILINIGMVRLLGKNEAELAFVIAHEYGHLKDADCFGVTPSSPLPKRRFCEYRADTWAAGFLIYAGYDPYAGAELMGKMMAVQGNATVESTLAQRYNSDHPPSLDRIQFMGAAIRTMCQKSKIPCKIGSQ